MTASNIDTNLHIKYPTILEEIPYALLLRDDQIFNAITCLYDKHAPRGGIKYVTRKILQETKEISNTFQTSVPVRRKNVMIQAESYPVLNDEVRYQVRFTTPDGDAEPTERIAQIMKHVPIAIDRFTIIHYIKPTKAADNKIIIPTQLHEFSMPIFRKLEVNPNNGIFFQKKSSSSPLDIESLPITIPFCTVVNQHLFANIYVVANVLQSIQIRGQQPARPLPIAGVCCDLFHKKGPSANGSINFEMSRLARQIRNAWQLDP